VSCRTSSGACSCMREIPYYQPSSTEGLFRVVNRGQRKAQRRAASRALRPKPAGLFSASPANSALRSCSPLSALRALPESRHSVPANVERVGSE
jgi:hypothetical protein